LTGATARVAKRDPAVWLLDGNVLVALVSSDHVHHGAATQWFAATNEPFATCPITQGTLLRLLVQIADATPSMALGVLTKLTKHPRHRFWPDSLQYTNVQWSGVLGHRQITDAYLAALARHHGGRMVTFDGGLAALHADVAVEIAAH
jgi:uncharacterized protein